MDTELDEHINNLVGPYLAEAMEKAIRENHEVDAYIETMKPGEEVTFTVTVSKDE